MQHRFQKISHQFFLAVSLSFLLRFWIVLLDPRVWFSIKNEHVSIATTHCMNHYIYSKLIWWKPGFQYRNLLHSLEAVSLLDIVLYFVTFLSRMVFCCWKVIVVIVIYIMRSGWRLFYFFFNVDFIMRCPISICHS